MVGIGPSPTLETNAQVPKPIAGLVAAMVALVEQFKF